ncbi:MAG: response regulator [Clostridiales Family XIII bacterium]|jgi:signal transduction histidine kinase/ActR/RegA family two-component response regulator|nr:response regulator [Clostridiales Family XIII bacterium]
MKGPAVFHKRVFIILVLCLTAPFIATWYMVNYFSETVFYEQQSADLLSLARVLDSRIGEDGYAGILREAGAENASREEQIAVLNEALRKDTDDLASVAEGLGVGFYSLELDAILTYGPSSEFGDTIGNPIDPAHPGREVMATGRPEVRSGTMVRGDIMNAMLPVQRNGTVIGYIWANQLTSELNHRLRESSAAIITFLVLAYILMVCIILLFFRRMIQVERKSLAAIEEAAEKAFANARAKSTFLASMSHEIRTPMNAIIGMASIGKSAAGIERKDYSFGKIQDASTHLLGVINDVLDLSKIESGKLELSPAEFVFAQMIERARNVIDHRIAEENQTLTTHIDENIPERLVCDDQRLAQVIVNLLSNAVKFTPKEGKITLSAKLEQEAEGICTLQISVADTGIGISREQQKRIFNSFEQAEASTTRKYGGTGLGLSISKNIVEQMGGHIRVDSEEGKGSAFIFTIQAARGAAGGENDTSGEASAGQAAGQSTDFTGRRILLAEDIEINREIIQAMLETSGIGIDCAANGAEAVRLFSRAPGRYDMIFMDVQIPEMDGLEATGKIRALDMPEAKTVPIVAMTANVFREDIERCLAAGMDDHVGKPIDQDTVLAKLRQHLR